MTDKDEWTDEWPTESGCYWLYGWTFLPLRGYEHPCLYLVVVRKVASGLAYYASGRFMCAAEGARGVWQKAILPELPPSEMLE